MNDLVFTSRGQLDALRGPRPLVETRARNAGIAPLPTDPVLRAIAAGTLWLIETRLIARDPGAKEFALLIDAAQGADDQLAGQLVGLVAECRQLKADLARLDLDLDSVHKEIVLSSKRLEKLSEESGTELRRKAGEIVFDVGDIIGNIMLRDRSGLISGLFDLVDDLDEVSRVLRSKDAGIERRNLGFLRARLANIQETVSAVLDRMKALGCR